MFTHEEQIKLSELMNSNEDFSYFINKYEKECNTLSSQFFHEARNPLTLIKSTAQLIESNYPQIHEIKYWDQLVEDIESLEVLLTELSMYRNGNHLRRQVQDLLLPLKSVFSTFKPWAEQKEIMFSFDISEEDIHIFSHYSFDQIKFQQVFTNLIKNAFEAVKEKGTITIECKALLPDQLLISIRNNGPMIPSNELETIFEPFVTYKSSGTGLGLSISSKIVQAHGGSIKAVSTEEETVFHIYLPLSVI